MPLATPKHMSKVNNTFRKRRRETHFTILFQSLNLGRMWEYVNTRCRQLSNLQILTTINHHGCMTLTNSKAASIPKETDIQSSLCSNCFLGPSRTMAVRILIHLSQHLASLIFTKLPQTLLGYCYKHFYPNYGSRRYLKTYINILPTKHIYNILPTKHIYLRPTIREHKEQGHGP